MALATLFTALLVFAAQHSAAGSRVPLHVVWSTSRPPGNPRRLQQTSVQAAFGQAAASAAAQIVQAAQGPKSGSTGATQLNPGDVLVVSGAPGSSSSSTYLTPASAIPDASITSTMGSSMPPSSSAAAGSAAIPVVAQGASSTTAAGAGTNTAASVVNPSSSSSSTGPTSTTGGINVSTSTPVSVYTPVTVNSPQQQAATVDSLWGIAQDAVLLASALKPRIIILPVFRLPKFGGK